MPPRLKDIAEAAGVDIGTVSHVLNRRPKADCLRAETREKILRIAEELGYCRNEMAASVAKKHGNVLAFICEDMGAVDYTGRIQNGILEEGMPPVKPIWKSSKSCNKLPLELKSGGDVWNAKDGVVNIGSRSCRNIGIAA